MVGTLASLYVEKTLRIGAVYKMEAPELISTSIPHYFIIVARDCDDNFLVLCSASKEARVHHIEVMGYDYSTLIFIKPDKKNGLSKDTYVNCNDYYPFSKQSLIKKCNEGLLIHTGDISFNHYDQIRTGIHNSFVNDLPSALLVHPEE